MAEFHCHTARIHSHGDTLAIAQRALGFYKETERDGWVWSLSWSLIFTSTGPPYKRPQDCILHRANRTEIYRVEKHFHQGSLQKKPKQKVTWHRAKYGDPYTEFVLCIYPSKWTNTQSSGQPFMLRRPGSSWGFLLKGTSVVLLRVERTLYIHSPHLQFLPGRDSNSQPLNYEYDSLTIRPRF